ncbi:MAG: hypothetical protein U5L95_00755 [Candidatus Saccharibacteria bacterium]|nr:hypothetical protein [Candidatus Saccharibacteria bacterium]
MGNGNVRFNSTNNTLFINAAGDNVGIGDNGSNYKLEVQGSGPDGYLAVSDAADGDILSIDSSQNVGIGNASPDTDLEVTGGLCVSDATGDDCSTATGNIQADGSITANAFDLAERYGSSKYYARYYRYR